MGASYNIPLLVSQEQDETQEALGVSFAFDFDRGDFVLSDGKLIEISGIDALKVWVQKCLSTVSQRYVAYMQDDIPYGMERLELTDRSVPQDYLYAEMERVISAALLRHPQIYSISGFAFVRSGRTLEASATITTAYGEESVKKTWTQ